MKHRRKQPRAFTLVELLVVIAIIAVLAAIQLPALANTKAKVQRVYCSGNLKRVGIAFRTWAESHNSLMPMSVLPVQGGASSAVGVIGDGSFWAANYPASGPRGVFGMFAVMTNHLATPKILYCPSESSGTIFQGSIFGNTLSTNVGFYSDSGTSYFVGVDADERSPNMLLAGDHNLGTSVNQTTHVPRFVSAGTNSNWPVTAIGWQNNQHAQQGNVTFADGSVQNLNTTQLRVALNNSGDQVRSPGVFPIAPGSSSGGLGVNRLQMPKYN